MTKDQAESFRKLLNGELSPEETESLVSLLGAKELDQETEDLITSQLKSGVELSEISPELKMTLESKLPAILGAKRVSMFQQPWLRYAAAVIGLMGIGLSIFLTQKATPPQTISPVSVVNTSPVQNDIAPGREGAILTLADGKTILLDSLGNGVIATDNGARIVLKDGNLSYDKNLSGIKTVYNTISTPRGRHFELTLSDGTKVWMNAASSLRYPTIFSGNERRVEITGEAYFEVARNTEMPFKISVNRQTEIEVLGTHFNVNSYEDEATINTTLLEGSVRVYHNGQNTIMKPGQQVQVAQLNNPGLKLKKLDNVNISRVMAWKNGVFDFENATLEEVMRQLERWYDVDVVYEKGIPKLEFYGSMGRDLTLSNLLRGLKMSKVNFRVEGKKLVVLP